jgi:hypothetical protein
MNASHHARLMLHLANKTSLSSQILYLSGWKQSTPAPSEGDFCGRAGASAPLVAAASAAAMPNKT